MRHIMLHEKRVSFHNKLNCWFNTLLFKNLILIGQNSIITTTSTTSACWRCGKSANSIFSYHLWIFFTHKLVNSYHQTKEEERDSAKELSYRDADQTKANRQENNHKPQVKQNKSQRMFWCHREEKHQL